MLCLSIGPKNDPGAASIKDGLLAWYDFENANDSHTTGRTLIAGENVVYGPNGLLDKSANMLAANNDFLVYDGPVLGPRGPRTWAGWVYFDDLSANHSVLAAIDSSAANIFKLAHTTAATGSLRLFTPDANATKGTFLANEWVFVAVKYDPSTNNWTLDVNDSGTPATAADSVPTVAADDDFLFGAIGDGDANYIQAINGRLDSWGVWGRLLTAAELTSLYNTGNGKKYSTL